MAGSDKVLVYRYRAGRNSKDLEVLTNDEVNEEIRRSAGSLQKTTKEINGSVVSIKEKDLRTAEQQTAWDSKPNAEAEVASVRIPVVQMLKGIYGKGFKELTILTAAKVLDGK